MRRFQLTAFFLIAAAFTLTFAGCRAGEGVTNVMGSYETFVAATPDEVAEAAVATINELDLVLIDKSATKLDAQVLARSAQDEPITIKIDREGNNVSKVRVRAGTVGDEDWSLQIIEGIKRRL